MKKAQQEDLIISELLENIDKIKTKDFHLDNKIGNVYCLSSLFIYKQDTISYKFTCYLIFGLCFIFGLLPVRFGDYIICITIHSIGIVSMCYYYLYKHNVYVYSQSKFIRQFSRKNQKQIRSIIMQVETKNILNSINN